MANYDIDTLHQCIENILTEIDKTCRQHNLRYFICTGTLLGAVRHKGFIPWDDDIDICMPRNDYETLIAHKNEWLPQHLEMICTETNPDYLFPFAKIQDARTTILERVNLPYLGGAYIDVFPLSGIPDSKVKQSWHLAKYWYWKKVLYFCCRNPYKHGHGPSCWIPLLVQHCYTLRYIQGKMQKLQKKYDYDTFRLVVDYDEGMKSIMPRSNYGNGREYAFNKHQFIGPEEAHDYLKRIYNDYMTIPKQSEQKQHNFDLLKLDVPYKEYRLQKDKRMEHQQDK